MNQTNCSNCGAPIDWDIHKCPFCGTQYIDFTEIDFIHNTPVILRLKSKYQDKEVIIEQTAVPRTADMSMETNTVQAYSGKIPLCSFEQSISVNTDILFTAIPSKNGTLYTIKTKSE